MGIENGDFKWFTGDPFDRYWINGFCLTVAADKSADLVKEVLLSSAGATIVGTEEYESLFVAHLFTTEHGTIMLEHGGFAGYTIQVAGALSQNTRVAVVMSSPTGSPWFGYLENGVPVCTFNIMQPEPRGGSSPDRLLPELTAAGLLPIVFPEWETEEDELELMAGEAVEETNRVIQAISIASRITDVPFTRHTLENPRHSVTLETFLGSDDETLRRRIWG